MEFNDLVEVCIVGTVEIKELLRNSDVAFIIDNVGQKKLISKSKSFDFWKQEVKDRIVEPQKFNGFYLEEYPNEYCYIARECRNISDIGDTTVYIVLQMFH